LLRFDELVVFLNEDFPESPWAGDENSLDVEQVKIAHDPVIRDFVYPSPEGLPSRFVEDREKVAKEPRGPLEFSARRFNRIVGRHAYLWLR
jgi:hypothetical protein